MLFTVKLGVLRAVVPAQAFEKMPTSTVLMSLLAEAASMLNAVLEPFTVNLLNSWNPGDVPDTRS